VFSDIGHLLSPVNDRNEKKMLHAEGSLTKLLFLLAGVAAALAVMTFSTPYLAQYQVKQAAKLTCNSFTRGNVDINDRAWREDFVRKASVVGVMLKSDQQYHFAIEKQTNLNRWHCTFKVAWRSETPVFLLGDFLPEVPPLKLTHRIDDSHDLPIRL
jgi:hypothetical protein